MAPIQSDSNSLLHIERISQYVSLSPASLSTPLPSLCASIFSPLLLSYFPPARGIVLAYEDVSLSATAPASTPTSRSTSSSTTSTSPQQQEGALLLRHVDEYSAPYLWATASFLIWRPTRHAWIRAIVTHQSQTHISFSCLNTFPVSVLKEHLPSTWTWHSAVANAAKKGWDGRVSDEGGWWVDGEGQKVVDGREMLVRVRDVDGRMDGKGRGKGVLRVEASLLGEDEEGERRKGKGKGREKGVLKRTAGEAVEVE